MEIKVLGPGCPKCHEAEKVVRTAVAVVGVEASVSKVSDFAEIAKAGVFATPAVMVDGAVKCSGRVPSMAEVATWVSPS